MSNTEKWATELRDYIDKTLKPKKQGMKNLDREIIIDFVRNLLNSHTKEIVEKVEGIEHEYDKEDEVEYRIGWNNAKARVLSLLQDTSKDK